MADSFLRTLARAFIPAWIVLIASAFVLPLAPQDGMRFFEMTWYQQGVSVATLPAAAWSLWRFHRLMPSPTPEEGVLEEEMS